MRRKLIPFISVLFVLLGVKVSLALTLADIRTAIRRNVRDTASTTALRRYPDALLLAYANEAQRSIIRETWARSSRFTFGAITAGTTFYSYSSVAGNAIHVYRVTLDDVNLPELDVAQLDADTGNGSWFSTSGTPAFFYRDKYNPHEIGLYPNPSASGAILKISYYKLVSDMVSESDVPFDSDFRLYTYHDLIVFYASYRILVSENRLAEAAPYQALYLSALEAMGRDVGHKPIRPIKPSKEINP